MWYNTKYSVLCFATIYLKQNICYCGLKNIEKGYTSMRFKLNSKKKAQSLIEYALILAMVAVVAIAALQLLGNNIGSTLTNAADTVGKGSESAGQNACTAMGSGFQWDSTNKSCKYNPTNP